VGLIPLGVPHSFVNGSNARNFRIEFEREDDGRWLAEIADLPGVLAYGATREEAEAAVEALALRVIADRIEAEKVGQKTISFASV
jgi:predicted RNase H-like HicB family nuclease